MTSRLRATILLSCALIGHHRSAGALGASWESAGPFGGSAQVIAVDRRSPDVLLAGAQNTLLFRSDDAGESWHLLPFPRHYSGTVRAVMIDSEDSRYWVGISSEDPSIAGLWESIDGGEHWLRVSALAGISVESLATCPGNPRVIAAGTRRGVYLTTDHGRTWKQISPPHSFDLMDITVLAFHPTNPAVLYAGTPHLPWKTSDGGLHWRPIHNGMVDDSDVFSIHVDRSRPQTVFVSACSGIYRSNDGANTWRKLLGGDFRTHTILQDNHNPETVYAGTTAGLFRSLDGGSTWQRMSAHSVNCVSLDPNHSMTLYLATQYAGLLKSADGGVTFRSTNRGFVNRQIAGIVEAGNTLYANDNWEGDFGELFVSTDQGREWVRQAGADVFSGGNLRAIAGTTEPNLLFAATDRQVLKSADGGRTWSALRTQPGMRRSAGRANSKAPALQILDAFVRNGHAALFAGTDSGLFYCAEEGLDWEEMAIAGRSSLSVRGIYRSSTVSGPVVVSTAEGLFLSKDAGHNWSPMPSPGRGYAVYDLALSGDANGSIFAATSHGLFRFSDDGSRWQRQQLPLETVTSVRCDPNRPDVIFAAQYGRIYQSRDAGRSWTALPAEGLDGSVVDRLWLASWLPDRLFAIVQGQGILYLDLAQPPRAMVGSVRREAVSKP
jgi:photosystem II stability/assembly factor-like uncharacterized protein